MYSEIDSIKSKLVDRIILIMLIFLTPPYISAILRWIEIGWHNINIVHTLLFIILVLFIVYRKKISFNIKIYSIAIFYAILGLAALWYLGFSGIHYFVIISIALVAVFTVRRTAFVFVILIAACYITVGILYITGKQVSNVDLYSFSHSTFQWITIISSLIAFSAIFVAGFGRLHRELERSIKEKITVRNKLEEHVEELEVAETKLDNTIEELNAANHKLQISEEKFRQLIRNSFDMIILIDPRGNQRYVSESCERILGYTPEELIDIDVIGEMVHPDDKEKTREGLKSIFENNASGGAQYRHRHKNGSWVYLEAFGSNQISNPLVNAIILNVRDITERKNAELILKDNEANLKELNITKDKLFSIVAHDLKSPLSSIQGFSSLLNEEYDKHDDAAKKRYIGLIHKSVSNTYKLLTDLLIWARMQRNMIEFNPKSENLFLLTRKVLKTIKPYSKKKLVKIFNRVPEDMFVNIDDFMISTVIRNLVTNAVKYTNPGEGKIVITANEKINNLDHRIVEVCVRDNGVGITEKNQSNLFKVGENSSTSGTENEKGTGLGLLICYDFIKRHAGNIWVESEEGIGTALFFTLQG